MASKEMTTREKVLIGGLGGVAPVILNLLVIDYETSLSQATVFACLGFITRALVLFSVGAFWCYLHRAKEDDPIKLFELGLVAPAIIVGFMNAKNIPVSTSLSDHSIPAIEKKTATNNQGTFSIFSVQSVYAQTKNEGVNVPNKLQETWKDEFYRGLFGGTTSTFRNPSFRGFRLDWCLSWATSCGEPAATRWCQTVGYRKAIRWERDSNLNGNLPTYLIGTGQKCNEKYCNGFKMIECST